MMKTFWFCFVPMFVAVDALGVLPLYLGLTGGLSPSQKKKVLIQSLFTALFVAVIFILGGPALLRLVGVGVNDFMVAGGILLLVISLSDLLTGEKRQRMVDSETLGAVPIGVPLIVGPAVLTTSVLLSDTYGIFQTILVTILNVVIAIVIFGFSKPISGILGEAGTKTLSKIASLFLASISIMLIRRAIIEIVKAALN